jgi:prepilin-type N-terminal cleavage/methylation domain-containing protein
MTKKNSQSGFTLIELAMVIALLGILALHSFPSLRSIEKISVRGAMQKVEGDLQYAQSMATTTGQAHGFRTISPTEYEIYNAQTGGLVESPYHHSEMSENLAESFPGVEFQAESYEVEFDQTGAVSTGNQTVVLTNPQTGDLREIEITASTGKISSISEN